MEKIVKMEKLYQDFKNNLKIPISKDSLDFLGINLIEESEDVIFKAYYATKSTPEQRKHPLISFLYDHDMLRDFEYVEDTISKEYIRIDTAIKDRNDSNMKQLFGYLSNETPLFENGKEELFKLAKIKITSLEKHNFSSIYHLGSVQNNGDTECLKWYFLTRWCSDLNTSWIEYEYKDFEYLDYVKTINNSYKQLAIYIEELLKEDNGHLWMIGLDVQSEDRRKYKIYAKGNQWDLTKLDKITNGRLHSQIENSRIWRSLHPEYGIEGLALCLDETRRLICNLYFSFE